MNEQKRHTFHYNLLSQPCPGFGGGYGGMFSFIVDTKANLNCFFKCPEILKDDAVKVLHSTCQQLWKTQQWPQDWKRCCTYLVIFAVGVGVERVVVLVDPLQLNCRRNCEAGRGDNREAGIWLCQAQ